jgi:hypothetical protein
VTANAASVTSPVPMSSCPPPAGFIAGPFGPAPAGGDIAPSSDSPDGSVSRIGGRTRKAVRLTTGWPSSEMTR